MQQKITGFHLDAENHWVADLACGHKQHVRHDPPMVERPWVMNEKGREEHLGLELNCKRCDEVGLVVAEAIRDACVKMADEAYLEAGHSGLCEEGRMELIKDRLRSMDLAKISQDAIAAKTTELGTLT